METAYLRKINAAGGINGRKVTLVSLDDAFSPPKTVEQTRKLVESDDVLAIVGSVGTPTNLAVAKYLNSRAVPQILLLASTPKLDDPENLPWTTTFMMPQPVETASMRSICWVPSLPQRSPCSIRMTIWEKAI